MRRKIFYPLVIVLLLVLTGSVWAQDGDQPINPQHSDPNWQATYWNNVSLSGTAVMQRAEPNLDWDWGTGSPGGGVNADGFSARWTRYIDVPAGPYRFYATSDDGIRVWVDDRLIIDQWNDHAVLTFSADVNLSAGHHLLRVEYYENAGLAVAKVRWEAVNVDPNAWSGSYFANANLGGQPSLVRSDAAINFNWGYGSPAPGLPADYFSARWTRTVTIPTSNNYLFTTLSDDGVRVTVDGNLVINDWNEHPAVQNRATLYLTAGAHTIMVEYFEKAGLASMSFTFQPLDSAPQGFRGEYFNNRDLAGTPVMVRDDTAVNFDWGYGAPGPGVAADNFSVRWTRTVNLPPGNYRFTATTDDGVRLWVNGHLLLDNWNDHPATAVANVIYAAGDTSLKMEYYENGGLAVAKLNWQLDSGGPPPGGAVIIDDADASFVKGGLASGWATANAGYNGRLTWTQNNDTTREGYNWGRWYPTLSAGRYEVFVYIPEQRATTTQARYWVSHRDGFTLRVVNQSATSGAWVSLGTYSFRGTRDDYVSLSDVTYEPYLSKDVAWDAVKWEPR